MSAKSEIENLIKVKLELAEKHERLALVCKSKPAKKRLNHRALRFRRQAATLQSGK
jgi:hypothetical protein